MNEHHISAIRKSHDATHKKNALEWCISMYHVIGLKQTCSIKNIALKAAKNCRCRGLLGRLILHFKLMCMYLYSYYGKGNPEVNPISRIIILITTLTTIIIMNNFILLEIIYHNVAFLQTSN